MSSLRRSSSSYGGFADGIVIRGVPLLTLYPGNIYWVDSNGGGGSKGTFNHPVTTISAAHDLVTTNNGDIILVKPGHAETLTATVDFSKSGFCIIGLGFADNRPTITMSHTSADDGWDFEGSNIVIYNIKFKDGVAGGTDVHCLNCSGDYIHVENCYFQMGTDMDTLMTFDTTAKRGFGFVGNTIRGTAAGVEAGLRFEAEHFDAYVAYNKWLLDGSAGMDTGCVIFVSGGDGSGHILEHDIVLGLGAAPEAYVVQTVVNDMSICRNINICGDEAAVNLGVSTASAFAFINCQCVEEGKGVPSTFGTGGWRPYAVTPAQD